MRSATAILEPILEDLRPVEELIAGVTQVEYPILAELLRHILQTKGKRLRPALVLLAARFHDYRIEPLARLATAIELLHTATLVHDDFIDNSPTRRGVPTLHRIGGRGAAILVGDYLFARAAVFCTETENVRVMAKFGRALAVICDGELRQLFSRGWWQQSRADYLEKIHGKTAFLFGTATETGAILSGAPEDQIAALREYGEALGMAFQIVDDVLDFVGDEAEMGKPVGGDLRQKTLTLPALWLLEQEPNHPVLRRLLEADGTHESADSAIESAVRDAVALVAQSPGIDFALSEARRYCDQAHEALSRLPDHPARRALADLADYVMSRTS